MLGLAILLLFNLAGLLLHQHAGIPFPPNVLGLILLTFALFTGLVKLEWIENTAHFLLQHMMLFFVPYIIAAAALTPMLATHALPIATALTLGTLLTMLATAALATALTRRP